MTRRSLRIATLALSIAITGCPSGDDAPPAADDSSSSSTADSSSTAPTTAPPTTTTASSTTDDSDSSSTGTPADSSSSESTSTGESSGSSSDDGSSSSDSSSESSGGGAAQYELLDPDAVHFGLDYQGWAGAWWQWCRGMPVTDHPLFDDIGTECARGQDDDEVFFLGGTFGGEPVMRTCTTPADSVVFIPIINNTIDNAGYLEEDWWSDEMNAAAVVEFMDSVDEVTLEIDGDVYETEDLAAYRVGLYQSSYDVPAEDNLFEYFGYDVPVAGTVDPTFGDGWYVMLDLEPGEHELRVYAQSDAFGFTVDASYTLTVE